MFCQAADPGKQQVQAKVNYLSKGRWDFSRKEKELSLERRVERALKQKKILCRETLQEHLSWSEALEVLRIWEYTGKVRRGYFVEGLSGIQFIQSESFPKIMEQLSRPKHNCIWLSALDPAQVYGKLIPHIESRKFVNVAGTCVAFLEGKIVAVSEKKGKVLRVFEQQNMEKIIEEYALAIQRKQIYGTQKRIVIKEYPAEAKELFHKYGFIKEMQDYVLYP